MDSVRPTLAIYRMGAAVQVSQILLLFHVLLPMVGIKELR